MAKKTPTPDAPASTHKPDAPKPVHAAESDARKKTRKNTIEARKQASTPAPQQPGEPVTGSAKSGIEPEARRGRPRSTAPGASLWTAAPTATEDDAEALRMLHAMADQGLHMEPSLGPRLLPPMPVQALPADNLPPVTEIRRFNTVRLIPSKYSESVLTRIADSDEDLELLFGLESATNDRLLAEANLRLGVNSRELVYNIPHARIVNAAFTHPHPQGGRFSLPYRGCWYAAFEIATARAEVMFHRNLQFSEIGWDKPEEMDYDQYLADFSGAFHDLRAPETLAIPRFGSCLDPDSYIRSQQLTLEMLEAGSPGILYPSTRRRGGQCIACFRPSLVGNVRKRDTYRLTWYPDRAATFHRTAKPQLATTESPESA